MIRKMFLKPSTDGRYYGQQSQILRGLWTPYGIISPMFLGIWPDGSVVITYHMNKKAHFTKEQKQKIKYVLLILLVCFLLFQFYRPEIPYQPISKGDINVPEDVKSILKRSCYDCHSNQTELKWFDQVAPAYWLVVGAHIIAN